MMVSENLEYFVDKMVFDTLEYVIVKKYGI